MFVTVNVTLIRPAASLFLVIEQLPALPPTCEITATDLNDAMLATAQSRGTVRPVTWQQADVMALPYDDASFGWFRIYLNVFVVSGCKQPVDRLRHVGFMKRRALFDGHVVCEITGV